MKALPARSLAIETVDAADRAIVTIVLPHSALVPAPLAAPRDTADERILHLGPRRWLVLSRHASATATIDAWERRLADVTHRVEDAAARFVRLRVTGPRAAAAIAEQTSHPITAPTATPRALLGDVPVVCCACTDDAVELLVDRSLAHYARAWLERALA